MKSKKLIENEEVRNVALGDILTSEQIHVCVDILGRPGLGDLERTKVLKDYLRTFAAELESKGVVADYLAYWLLANSDGICRSVAANN